jgi:hypothetical protein
MGVILPLVLLILATVAAAVVAYGIHPAWAQYPHGFDLILFSRRFEWPLIAVVLLLCIGLIALVISGRKRAWWLVGLAPILALFAHRFALDPDNAFVVNTQPNFVTADKADFVSDDDWVVGIVYEGSATAYPYAALYPAPLVVNSDQQSPLILMWSPFANRAIAVRTDRSVKASELEIVGMPANTLLIYNSRIGQFINGVTGQTMTGQQPAGFGATVPTVKTTWKHWVTLHPDTRVLMPIAATNLAAPTRPVLPYYPMPKTTKMIPGHENDPPETPVAFVETTPALALLDSDLKSPTSNVESPGAALLLVRDGHTGSIVAFDRQVDNDLFPIFREKIFPKFPQATLVDADSGSAWTADGRAIDGPLKGDKLRPVDVDDEVYLGVLRIWYPSLKILTPMALPAQGSDAGVKPTKPGRSRTPKG